MSIIAVAPKTIMPGMIRNRVSEIAGKQRMQVSDLAKKADISYDTAKRYWYGKESGITWEVLGKLCDALGVAVEELFSYIPENHSPSNGKDR